MPGIITSTMAASIGTDRASSRPSAPSDGQPDRVPLARQERVEDLAHDLLVVDDEDGSVAGHRSGHTAVGQRPRPNRGADAAAASGNDSVKRVPTPTSLSHVIVPSCSCTMP